MKFLWKYFFVDQKNLVVAPIVVHGIEGRALVVGHCQQWPRCKMHLLLPPVPSVHNWKQQKHKSCKSTLATKKDLAHFEKQAGAGLQIEGPSYLFCTVFLDLTHQSKDGDGWSSKSEKYGWLRRVAWLCDQTAEGKMEGRILVKLKCNTKIWTTIDNWRT